MGGALLGAGLVAAGLGLAFLAVDSPIASRLVPAGRVGMNQLPVAAMIWLLGLIAGGALLVAGANRLAVMVATLRSSTASRSPVARAMGAAPGDVVVVEGFVPQDGRPIPELVIGPFGVAVVHEMGPRDRLRCVGRSWEAWTPDGWLPTEHPVDRAAGDAERVRHWLTQGELDFVVRVYAALVAPDTSIPRSPLCAVITADQIPAWIAALPRQRSLSEGRRHLIVARARDAVSAEGRRRDW